MYTERGGKQIKLEMVILDELVPINKLKNFCLMIKKHSKI